MTYAKLTRLQTTTFNPKVYPGVEQFVTTMFFQIKDLDPTCSEIQICNSLIPLTLPVIFQRQLVSVKNITFSDMLESTRQLELIYDTYESKKSSLKSPTLWFPMDERLSRSKTLIKEVEVREEGTMTEPEGRQRIRDNVNVRRGQYRGGRRSPQGYNRFVRYNQSQKERENDRHSGRNEGDNKANTIE